MIFRFKQDPVTVLTPPRGWWNIQWRELWTYRDLAYLFAKRDVSVIYTQTILGPVWFLIQPVLTALVFSVVFGHVAKIGTDGLPHFLFYMTGILMWNYFRGIMVGTADSLRAISPMASKIYFPRLLVPLSFPLSNLVYFFWNAVILAAFLAYYRFQGAPVCPSRYILFLPVAIAYTALTAVGTGLWWAALTVKYRDLSFTLGFFEQIWLYATPIVYPISAVTDPVFKAILLLNPVTQSVEWARVMLLGVPPTYLTMRMQLTGWGISILVFLIGLALFNRAQRTFVDVV